MSSKNHDISVRKSIQVKPSTIQCFCMSTESVGVLVSKSILNILGS